MSTGREVVLGRIHGALAAVPADDAPRAPAGYRTSSDLDPAARVDQFEERVADYQATVTRLADDGVAEAIELALLERGVRRLVVPADLPAAWRPDGFELLTDSGQLSKADLDGADGVLTGCALGIAETGTIVLDAGTGQGRRALTLVPDYHLCVVRTSQVVGSVPEAVARLAPGRPTTFISGPSATSDIELNRVEGVHGPRTLDVLLVEG